MLDQYRLEGPVEKIELRIEIGVLNTLTKMESHSKIDKSELVNTALKRFIAAHKDFLPDPAQG